MGNIYRCGQKKKNDDQRNKKLENNIKSPIEKILEEPSELNPKEKKISEIKPPNVEPVQIIQKSSIRNPLTKQLFFCPKEDQACFSIFEDRSEHPDHINILQLIPSELYSFSFKCKLGQGAYGVVFLVVDSLEQKEKALKLMYIDDLTSVDREFQALKRLRHQNIIDYYEFRIIGKECTFVMELCNSDLDKLIKENKLDSQAKVKTFKEICKGIKYLHKVRHIK